MQHGTKNLLNSLAFGLLVCSLPAFANDRKASTRIIKTQPADQKKEEQQPTPLQRLREGATNFVMHPVRYPLNTLMMVGSAYGLTKLSLDVAGLIVRKHWVGHEIAYNYLHGVDWLLGQSRERRKAHAFAAHVMPADPRIDALQRQVDALTEITGIESCNTQSSLHSRVMTLEDRHTPRIQRGDDRQQPWGTGVAERRAMLAQAGSGKVSAYSSISGPRFAPAVASASVSVTHSPYGDSPYNSS